MFIVAFLVYIKKEDKFKIPIHGPSTGFYVFTSEATEGGPDFERIIAPGGY